MVGGEEMAGRATATVKDKSRFAATCSLLSQFLKEKKGGGLQGLGLGMPPAPAPAAVGAGGAFRPPTTMNLLSGLDTPAIEPNAADSMNLLSGLDTPAIEPNAADSMRQAGTEPPPKSPTNKQSDENARETAGEQAQQLTIFYGGKVVVFDNFPSTKVKDLIQIVSAGDGVDKNTGTGSTATQALPRPAQNHLRNLPVARRNSLHRFLEKRKGRMNANAPYQINSSVAPSKQANGDKSWLGFGQEVTIKQEI